MPWNGSGGFNREEDFTADLAAGPPASIVSAAKVDDEFDNFKDGLQNCLTRDGQNSPSANISFANNKITSLGNPTASADAANKGYVDGGAYLGGLVNGLTAATPAVGDLLGFADVSDSNNPKKATIQALVEAALGQTIADLNAKLNSLVPTGLEAPFSGTSAPTGWLLCDGSAVSRTTYSALFAVIGTSSGAGDGSTTFNVPDYRGRAPFGKDDMGGTAANRITNAVSGINGATLGAVGGSEAMQQHSHGITDPGHVHSTGFNWATAGGASTAANATTSSLNPQNGVNSATTGITINNAGTGTSQNMPPAIIRNWIIKT